MAIPFTRDTRHVIPRWHDSRTAMVRGELLPPSVSVNPQWSGDAALEEKKNDWATHHGVAHASDLVGEALVLDVPDAAREAAQYLLANEDKVPLPAVRMAAALLEPDSRAEPEREPLANQKEAGRRIREDRARLQRSMRNPFAWTDLALAYTSIAKAGSAERCIQVALALAPDSRFVLRAATRLHVHRGNPDKALRILRRTDKTPHDPWLVAAEVAVSVFADGRPQCAKIGRRLLESGRFDAFQTSELASALGTLELGSGSNRKAKKLFRRSLTDPTENSLAQAEWVSHSQLGIGVDPSSFSISGSYEAESLDRYYEGEWQQALGFARKWLGDEPFAHRAPVVGSYLAAALLEDYDEAVAIARTGLSANPESWHIRNNLVFALASAGRVAEAERELERFRVDAADKVACGVHLATSGLVMYRAGRLEQGRRCYARALEFFRSTDSNRSLALASLFWAREEALSSDWSDSSDRDRGLRLAATIDAPDVRELLERFDTRSAKARRDLT